VTLAEEELVFFLKLDDNERMDKGAITSTEFNFSGQTSLYYGKVRDVYIINDYLVMIATDRISAFDVILLRPIPFKGQVLNQMAEYFLNKTTDIVPNWLIAVPDPNVSIGKKLDPYKVEMVVRCGLVGHAWREYSAGKRVLCGEPMPDGLKEYDMFPAPIITPSTKADEGHDEDISAKEIVSTGLMSQSEFDELSRIALALFARGQQLANEKGLVLMDTKYEFGKDQDGNIYVIDEIHTPDSSRYFYKDSYDAFVAGKSDEEPRHLSKEFVREWLMERGFSGKDGQNLPEMDDEFVQMVSDRYVELYEKIVGEKFLPADITDPQARIETSINHFIQKH
jgi:phosphoribosylaminoimidazole-succinocarboxamide synthase